MTVYLEYFGFKTPPFRITPQPEYFFSGAGRGAILQALHYALISGEGLTKVCAEVGAGKTMLCRMLAAQLTTQVPAQIDVIFLPNPRVSEDELLLTLADELGLTQASALRTTPRIRDIEMALIGRFAAGRRVVLLIDEAHTTPDATLEILRLLSNLDAGQQSLLPMVLFAQMELEQKLAQPELRALRERISCSFTLPALSAAEVRDYLAWRSSAAGYSAEGLFTNAACNAIASAAQGLSRRVNLLADKALLAAFAESARQVTLKHARMAARECAYPAPSRWRPSIWSALGLILAVAAWANDRIAASSAGNEMLQQPAYSAFGAHYLATRSQLNAADAQSFTIVLNHYSQAQLPAFHRVVAVVDQALGSGRIMLYPMRVSGTPEWLVLVGLYPDRERAQAALNKILRHDGLASSAVKRAQIRTIAEVRREMLHQHDE